VEREARMEPPIQTEYFRSGGATILIFMEDGARAVISRVILGLMNYLPVSDSRIHGSTSRQDNVSVQILSDIDITLHDRVVGEFVDTSRFQTQKGRLEESFRSTESFVTNGDDLSIRKFIRLFESRGLSSSLHFLFKVKSNIAKLFLDITNNFTFSSGSISVTTFSEDLHEVISQITTSQIETKDSVWKLSVKRMFYSISFIDRNSVGNTITRVQDDTSSTSRSVKGKNSLDSNIKCRRVEGLKHDLGHLFTVRFWVEWSFSQENWVFFRSDTKFIVKGMMPRILEKRVKPRELERDKPDFFHIIPVGDNTVFDRVFQGQDTSLGLSFITNIRVLLTHTNHDTLVTWSTNNRRKDLALE
jgi:hypothetical protein